MMSDTLVVCLCAAWCHTCEEFRPAFERIGRAHPEARFLWLDIEDDAALVGELEIEDFPTLAVFREDAPLFYGPTLPQEGVVKRTLGSVLEGDKPVTAAPRELPGLAAALRARLERGDGG
jgi:thioredoxin reductase (NADPH)